MRHGIRMLWYAAAGLLLATLLGCGGGGNGGGRNSGLASATLTVTPSTGTNLTLRELTAQGFDSSGRPVTSIRTSWDWEDDGTFDTPYLDAAVVERVYETPGTHSLSVSVMDTTGCTAIAHGTVEVTEEVDNPMVVSMGVTPDSGTTQTVFTFTASAIEWWNNFPSTRDQAVPVGYLRWDWEDDGIFDTPYREFYYDAPPGDPLYPGITHTFSTPGVKRVRVHLKASGDRVGTAMVTVTVTE